jgi:mitochondrial import inner membrane translocase subunit TIM50
LFPQTAVTEDVETVKEQKKQDEEEKKEKETSWKRMKFG